MADVRFTAKRYPTSDSTEYAVWDAREGEFVENGEGTVIVFTESENCQRMADLMNVRCP